jgi:hypothetical protein
MTRSDVTAPGVGAANVRPCSRVETMEPGGFDPFRPVDGANLAPHGRDERGSLASCDRKSMIAGFVDCALLPPGCLTSYWAAEGEVQGRREHRAPQGRRPRQLAPSDWAGTRGSNCRRQARYAASRQDLGGSVNDLLKVHSGDRIDPVNQTYTLENLESAPQDLEDMRATQTWIRLS